MASKGLRVTGIDYMKEHLDMAKQNLDRSDEALKGNITLEEMDFHNLKTLEPGSFDGVYTMETLAHAHDAEKALEEFHRILKPGGKIVLHDYEHGISEEIAPHLLQAKEQVTRYGAIPTWGEAKYGYFEERLKRVGFENVVVKDYSENVRPMLRLFWMMAFIPNFFVQLFGLQASFVNTIAGAYMYRGQKYWRYLSISATKKTNKAT
ncbi:uncharacterized protein LMH87_007662 [Akanthomyces muscarius]|nr:uncharacterized protein LMH87_007662 [Akanthomyces muscarius]KAJ4161634.1 hypothetical protein LMH87_007662 [Akanthomyces muscarius]